MRADCAARLAGMPLGEIRLLGCNTAVRPSGRRAIRGLAALFETRVLGTRAPISTNDFDDGEFRSLAQLADQDDIWAWPEVTARGTTWWFGKLAHIFAPQPAELLGELRRESEAEVLEHLRGCPEHARPRSYGLAEGKAEGLQEGLSRGKAEALLAVLAARGVAVGDAERVRILGERDPRQLDRWLAGAATCAAAAELVTIRR